MLSIPLERVELVVGYADPGSGELYHEAEVRAANGADEYFIGMSPEYNRSPNSLVYRSLLLARAVVRLGPRKLVTPQDIAQLHVRDVRALECAIYRLTYGEEAAPKEDDAPG